MTTLSGRTAMAVERRREKRENSADADGGPRSRVRTAGHSAQPPIDVSGNFSAHVSAESNDGNRSEPDRKTNGKPNETRNQNGILSQIYDF